MMIDSNIPKQIHGYLNEHIVGQEDAKKAISIALVNRVRRRKLPDELRAEVSPKNILLIGPTGVGKTEIARRVAKLTNSPFIKVDATKFTEVGYVGNNVENIIKDLVELTLKNDFEKHKEVLRASAENVINEKLVQLILEEQERVSGDKGSIINSESARAAIAKQLKDGHLEKQDVSIQHRPKLNIKLDSPQALENISNNLQGFFEKVNKQQVTSKVKVHQAREILLEQEGEKQINKEEKIAEALENIEQNAIVFIDEIDKICSNYSGRDEGVSRQGVQRDLLPLIEGTTVNTRHGQVRTDHIFFVCSGAFHNAKPSDLMPELQGRLPVRVHLKGLDAEDLYHILSQPKFSLYEQYKKMLSVDAIYIDIDDDGLRAIGELAQKMNDQVENIGARRLHTLLEQLLKDIMYESKPGNYPIGRSQVEATLNPIIGNQDNSRYIL